MSSGASRPTPRRMPASTDSAAPPAPHALAIRRGTVSPSQSASASIRRSATCPNPKGTDAGYSRPAATAPAARARQRPGANQPSRKRPQRSSTPQRSSSTMRPAPSAPRSSSGRSPRWRAHARARRSAGSTRPDKTTAPPAPQERPAAPTQPKGGPPSRRQRHIAHEVGPEVETRPVLRPRRPQPGTMAPRPDAPAREGAKTGVSDQARVQRGQGPGRGPRAVTMAPALKRA